MMSTVTERGQTAIPAAIRKRYNLSAHSRIEWIDDGHSISVIPVPDKPVISLRGAYRTSNLSGALMTARVMERSRE